MSPEDAIRHALDGDAILFTGAGFSWGAENQENKKIPAGQALAEALLSEVGYKNSSLGLDKASAAYLRRKEPRDLVNFIVPKFTASMVSDSHRLIATLPFRRVYTTNYDDVLELARRETKNPYSSFDSTVPPRELLRREGLILHINGSISNLTEEKLNNSFKLTSGSYAADSFESTGWAFHFRQDLRAARAVIFIGYSMYDLDIRRVLFGEDMTERCVFVTAPLTKDNELDAEDLSDLGVLAPIGVDAFAALVEKVSDSYVPQEPEVVRESWLQIDPSPEIDGLPNDQEVLDALLIGRLSERLLTEAAGPNCGQYSIPRSQRGAILEDLRTGLPTVLVGDLGSGKTFLLELLARELTRGGVDVFALVNADRAIEEVQSLVGRGRTTLLVIENYHRHMDVLRWIGDAQPVDVSVVMSARSSSHDLFQAELLKIFGDKLRLHEMVLLDAAELKGATDLLGRYGLWAGKSGWSPERKLSYLRHECASSLPSLLLDVLNSEHISRRYKSLIEQSAARSDVERVLVCIFVLEIMGFLPTLPKVQELLSHTVNWAGIRSQTNLQPIVDFKSNEVRARSSVLGLHLMHHVLPPRRIVDVMIEMTKAAEALRDSKEFFYILNGLMRYGGVSTMLPEHGRLETTISFYEGIKNLRTTSRNPQFWLQYAIACLALGRLERAGRYFKTSYALVFDGYDTSKIDNHYARYLVEVALNEPAFNDGKRFIDQAAAILLQQMADEVKFYPYRVALGIFKFYDRTRASHGPSDKQSFRKMFSQIHKRASGVRGALRNNRYVSDCLDQASKALADLGDVAS